MSEKKALITGANRGLGFETARELGKKGYTIFLVCRDGQSGSEATEKLKSEGINAELYLADVTQVESVRELERKILSRTDSVDVLINNAGVIFESNDFTHPEHSSALRVDRALLMRSLETNTLGPYQLIQMIVPFMTKKGGRIVNVSSGMGQLSEMGGSWPGYRISKTALNALTRIFSEELKPQNIKVNSVCPGWVRTDMGGPNATRSLQEGASGIVWAATLDDSGPTGGFFRDGQPIDW